MEKWNRTLINTHEEEGDGDVFAYECKMNHMNSDSSSTRSNWLIKIYFRFSGIFETKTKQLNQNRNPKTKQKQFEKDIKKKRQRKKSETIYTITNSKTFFFIVSFKKEKENVKII